MPVESATYINGLNASYPPATDLLTQADDHLRLIKSVLKTTFPNIDAPVTSTPDALNAVAANAIPIGVISIWYGSDVSVPTGWAICNGQVVARTDGAGNITTPDLRGRVVLGADGTNVPNTPLGATTATAASSAAGSHSHTITGGDHSHTGGAHAHALSEAELPPHTHYTVVNAQSGTNILDTMSIAEEGPGSYHLKGVYSTPGTGISSSTGSGAAHAHGITVDSAGHSHGVTDAGNHAHSTTVSTIQPSMALHFIMRH